MAYFQRADERDRLILCNICNVKCSERSLTNHKAKCYDRNLARFKKGDLIRCTYDSSHIIEAGKLEDHKEFCNKYQNEIVAQFQEAMANATPDSGSSPVPNQSGGPTFSLGGDMPAREGNNDALAYRMSNLEL